MSNTTATLKQMLSKGEIIIPIIQRDYVQGSNKQEERRNEFVESLISTLTSENKTQNLDFIYGRTNETKEFLPLDGQQRLTTLFLFTWFLYKKVDKYSEIKDFLRKFSYKTRISTTSFCKLLVNLDYDLKRNNPKENTEILISDIIKDNIHYDSSWNLDPTIQSMLDLLDYLQRRFDQFDTQRGDFKITDDVLTHMYERMRDGAICFDLLDMNDDGFKMTDELYIKMNARGKQLTEFENFKAWFINKLENDCSKELKEEFCEKIEYDWTRLFWPYAIKHWEMLSEKEQAEERYPTIDEMIQNLIEVISELLFFKDHLNSDNEDFIGTKKQYSSVYFNKQNKFVDESNIKFLFNTLDFFYNLSKEGQENNPNRIKLFFDNFFTLSAHLPDDTEKVRLFGIKSTDNYGTNLFDECIFSGRKMDVSRKIILFCLLNANENHSTKENMYYIRVVRNLLETIRQRNDTSYNSNIRINHFGSYWILLSQLSKTNDVYSILIDGDFDRSDSKFTDFALKHEAEKAALYKHPENKKFIFSLEDNEEIRGNIHNLHINQNLNNLQNYAKYLYELFNSNIDDSLLSRALIAFEYDGLYIKNCKLGETYYFGKKPNWDVIFTYDYDNSSPNYNAISAMLNSITENSYDTLKETLISLIESRIKDYSKDDWQYYFLKYASFTSSKFNYTVYKNVFEWRALGSNSSNPLLAYHINLYVREVCKQINNKSICDENKCCEQYGNISPLKITGIGEMFCTVNGWLVEKIDGKYLKNKNIKEIDNKKYLIPLEDEDMISCAVSFVKSIKS